MRYDVDVPAATSIVKGVESGLDEIDRADTQFRSCMDAVGTALQMGRVGPAFNAFTDAVAMADARSVVAGGWNAVGGASTAVQAYRSGDEQMATSTIAALGRVW
ncbi:hypothetical protein GCM10027402_28590 [Arthrobacter monumenti]